MSSLVVEFSIRIRKRAANAQEGTTLGLEVWGDKRSRLSRFDEEVQDDPAVIFVDSSERVLEASFVVGSVAQDASRNTCAMLEDEALTEEFPRVDDASIKASLFVATDAPPS